MPVYKKLEKTLKYYLALFLAFLYGNRTKIEEIPDNSWKGIKIATTWKPPFYPKIANENTLTRYFEVRCMKEDRIWKRI